MYLRLATAAILGLLFLPAQAPAQTAPRNCSVVSQNQFVRDALADLYLWSEFLPEVKPAAFPSPEAFLDAVRYRPLDTTYSYITSAAANDAFYSDSQFIGYGFATGLSGSELRVLQVFTDSPSAAAGMARGDRILSVDGRDVAAAIESGDVGSLFGASQIGVTSTIVFRSRNGESRSGVLTKRLVTIPTVSLTQVYEVDGRKVGYLFFRNFVRPSMAALNEAFAALQEAGVSELVLDLRYNGGGLVDVAVHLASLIGGATTRGQVLANYVHNPRNAHRNQTLRFDDADAPLALSRLVVIATRSSASASELVINALRPYLPVAIVGDTTYGKPVGQYGLEFCSKVLAPVAFSLMNAANEGDYFSGLSPTCTAADDIEHDLGDAAESSLAEAFAYIRTGACSTPPTTARTLRVRVAPQPATGWNALVNAW